MRTVVIGACGHIGTYLVPRLVLTGHEVVAVSRGTREPYFKTDLWKNVESVFLDREKEEKEGTFGKKILALKPDIVIDLISFETESTIQLVEALRGQIQHYLYCSSIWAHGAASVVPAPEDLPRYPICDYGRKKAKTEEYLHEQYRMNGFPETVFMPGHITGPGWDFINPSGNKDVEVWGKVVRGEEILIPNFGMETVHHVHADDVAQLIMNCIIYRNAALGESFHAVAPHAMTLRGFAENMFRWFGHEPNFKLLPWEEWCKQVGNQEYINSTESHLLHSDNYSIEKGRRLINYNPRYTIVQACCEGLDWMLRNGWIHA